MLVNGLTVQEKKDGYANVLHHLLIDIRANLIGSNQLVNIAHILHEMPPYLARDLEGWDDGQFWSVANDFAVEGQMINTWFQIGVEAGIMQRQRLSRG